MSSSRSFFFSGLGFSVRTLIAAVAIYHITIFFSSCSESVREENAKLSDVEIRQKMEDAHKVLIQKEKSDIQSFIGRHQFVMDSTGTGLRYTVYRKGGGPVPKEHDAVVIAYKVWLLTGEQVYDITAADPDTARLAEGRLISGVEEALFMMPEGSKVRLVLPAHLAYGMAGDENKIPGATALYYDLELIKVNP